jgi:hypothetical protein
MPVRHFHGCRLIAAFHVQRGRDRRDIPIVAGCSEDRQWTSPVAGMPFSVY